MRLETQLGNGEQPPDRPNLWLQQSTYLIQQQPFLSFQIFFGISHLVRAVVAGGGGGLLFLAGSHLFIGSLPECKKCHLHLGVVRVLFGSELKDFLFELTV